MFVKILNGQIGLTVIFYVTISVCLISCFDLLAYYLMMVFPMETFFVEYRRMKKMMILWRFMWVFVTLELFFILSYLIMAFLWFIIGAIINPNAYLPFASAAVTLVTVI